MLKVELPDLPESANKALENLSDKPTKAIGETLSNIWYLIFGDIDHRANVKRAKYAALLQQYEVELGDAFATIPQEHKKEPTLRISGHALEKSKYVLDEPDLRKMFVNLIAKDSDSRYAGLIHPSFAGIIEQMSTLDAVVFQEYYKRYRRVNVHVINPRITLVGTSTYVTGAAPEWFMGWWVNGYSIFDFSTCLINLSRLGLIELLLDRSSAKTPEARKSLIESPALHELLHKNQSKYELAKLEIEATDSICYLTEFGGRFAECCL